MNTKTRQGWRVWTTVARVTLRKSVNVLSAAIAVATLCVPAVAGAQTASVQIAFQSDRGGSDDDLWLVDSSGGDETPLTINSTPDASPSWSPDGTTIVYACAPRSNWEVCTIDPATRKMTQLTHTAAQEFDPRYTADGRQIVLESYPTYRNADIAVMPAGGGTPRPLKATPGDDDQDPAPDPRGSRVAFASDGSIVVVDSTSSASATRVAGTSGRDTDPAFSSRDEIAFAGRRGRSLDIVVAGPAATPGGARTVRTLTTSTRDDLQPAWTADGSQLFFARSGLGRRGFRIYRVGAGGGGQQAVTKGGAYDDMRPAPRPVASGVLARALRVPPTIGGELLGRASADLAAVAATTCTTSNTINGNNSANTLTGTSKSECINGFGANDKLTGKLGSDRLIGGTGNDKLLAIDNVADYVNGNTGANSACTDPVIDTRVNTVAC